MLEQVKQFVKKSFHAKDPTIPMTHYEWTVYWVKELRPDADESILIAAYAHDIGRAFTGTNTEFWGDKELTDPEALDRHQKECEKRLTTFLTDAGYDADQIKRIGNMVRYHEVGGDKESDLIKDADSISYLEVNAPRHVEKFTRLFGKGRTRRKFDFMLNRITDDRAKVLALPFYEKAIVQLDAH